MKIQLVVRSYGLMIGLARYTLSLCRALEEAGIEHSLARPQYPWVVRAGHRVLKPFGYDVRTFFTTYPLAAGPLQRHSLTHLTTQQMATLLRFGPDLHPAVVTVHDIVPYLVRHDRRQSTFRNPLDAPFDELAVKGLRRAESLIAVSEFTRQTVIRAANVPGDRIRVVHEGVRHDLFRPLEVDSAIFDRFGLRRDLRYLLYVGSEEPRKNLPRLLAAFRELHDEDPDLRLIKIGSVQYGPQADELRRQVIELGLNDCVLFLDHVSDADLACFYNLAALFVFPSLLEGFGLPVLEAMACGTPVITSNAASLPEVAGDAALLVDPLDVHQLAGAMRKVLAQPDLAADLRRRGLARAAQFTWERTARETIAVYERVAADYRR